jgi:hypothetical protein
MDEQGYDEAIWVGELAPVKWSSYDGKRFTDPDKDYLISIGVLTAFVEVPEIIEE